MRPTHPVQLASRALHRDRPHFLLMQRLVGNRSVALVADSGRSGPRAKCSPEGEILVCARQHTRLSLHPPWRWLRRASATLSRRPDEIPGRALVQY